MLDEEPFRVHFFQAVRLLQKMERERKPVGYFITPQGETIRFSARTSLAFPPSEIHELRRAENGQIEHDGRVYGALRRNLRHAGALYGVSAGDEPGRKTMRWRSFSISSTIA